MSTTPTPWQEPSYSFRLPVSIGSLPYSANDTTLSLVIPRKALPKELMTAANISVVARTKDGRPLPLSLAPQASDSAILAWVTLAKPAPKNELLLYVEKGPADAIASFSPTPAPDLLLLDGFSDPTSLLSDSGKFIWDPWPFSKGKVPIPALENAPGRAVTLPESTSGYTVEAKVSESGAFTGGPFVVLASGKSAVSLNMLDENHWQAAIRSENSADSVTKTIDYQNQLSQPVVVRLDVPQAAGSLVRFFLDGRLVFQSPFLQSMIESPTLYLLPRDGQDHSTFYYVAVRSYQTDQPSITLGQVERRPN